MKQGGLIATGSRSAKNARFIATWVKKSTVQCNGSAMGNVDPLRSSQDIEIREEWSGAIDPVITNLQKARQGYNAAKVIVYGCKSIYHQEFPAVVSVSVVSTGDLPGGGDLI